MRIVSGTMIIASSNSLRNAFLCDQVSGSTVTHDKGTDILLYKIMIFVNQIVTLTGVLNTHQIGHHNPASIQFF